MVNQSSQGTVLVLMAASFISSTPSFAQIRNVENWLSKPAINFTRPRKKADKIDFVYKASEVYIGGATWFDMFTTVRGMDHPTVAMRADGSVLMRYHGVEVGWAKIVGDRNTGAVVAANVALNAGLALLSRRLYQRGGRWRYAAIAVNVLKGTDNALAAYGNIRYGGSIDERIRAVTGYTGPIHWSH